MTTSIPQSTARSHTKTATALAELGYQTARLHRGDISAEQALATLQQLEPHLPVYDKCQGLTLILEEVANIDAALLNCYSDFFLATAQKLQDAASNENARRLLLEMPYHDHPIPFAYRLPITAALRASEVLDENEFAKLADAAAESLAKAFGTQPSSNPLALVLANTLFELSHKHTTSLTATAFALMKHRKPNANYADCCQIFAEKACNLLASYEQDEELQYARSSILFCLDVTCGQYPLFDQHPILPLAILSLAPLQPDMDYLYSHVAPYDASRNSLYTTNDQLETEPLTKKLIKVFRKRVPPLRHRIAKNGLNILCGLVSDGICHEGHDRWIQHLSQIHPGGKDFWVELMTICTLFLIKAAPKGLFLGHGPKPESQLLKELDTALFSRNYNQLGILLDFECENISAEILKLSPALRDCWIQNLSQAAEKCVACASGILRLFERTEVQAPPHLQARLRLLSIYDIAATCATTHSYSCLKLFGPDPIHDPRPPAFFFKILKYDPNGLREALLKTTSHTQQTVFLALNTMLYFMRHPNLTQVDMCYKPTLLWLQNSLCKQAGRQQDAQIIFNERAAYLADRTELIQSLFDKYKEGGEPEEIQRLKTAFGIIR